jgi:hypothetical protein
MYIKQQPVLTTLKEQFMEHIILNTNPIINGEITSNFVHIIDISEPLSNMSGGGTYIESCNVYISNREATVYNISITNNDIQTSIDEYFVNISDKE